MVFTRHGIPVADLIPHKEKKGGLNLEAMRAYKKLHGIDRVVEFIPDDLMVPLPADFLIRPLPKA